MFVCISFMCLRVEVESVHIIFSTNNRLTDRSLQYAYRRLWNQLPASLRQPRTNLSNSASPSSFSGTSSISSIDSPLSSSITPSLFHSRPKTFLFCKSFPPQPFLFFFRTDYMDSHRLLLLFLKHIRLYFLVFLFYTFSRRFRAVDKAGSCPLSSAR